VVSELKLTDLKAYLKHCRKLIAKTLTLKDYSESESGQGRVA